MKYKWNDAEQYIKVYKEQPTYGSTGTGKYSHIIKFAKENKIKSIFDFGCGLNYSLLKKIKQENPEFILRGYDPAILDWQETSVISNKIPDGYIADMIISTDCMEHIPEQELGKCWSIFNNINPNLMFITICTRPAGQILPDGTNAHKTVKPLEWWTSTLSTALPSYAVKNLKHEPKQEKHWKNHINILITKK